MPMPSSSLPGHQPIHERATSAVDTCVELPNTEFKRSLPWNRLQWQLLKAIMGLANHPGGGLIVIGLAEEDDGWSREGMEPSHFDTYDPDRLAAAAEKYIDPPPTMTMVSVEHEKSRYIAIIVDEFEFIPHCCRRDPPETERVFKKGTFYYRPSGGVARTEPVQSADGMQLLIKRAAIRYARQLIADSQAIGMTPEQSPSAEVESDSRFDEELDGI